MTKFFARKAAAALLLLATLGCQTKSTVDHYEEMMRIVDFGVLKVCCCHSLNDFQDAACFLSYRFGFAYLGHFGALSLHAFAFRLSYSLSYA
jgi:hypothetical protein